MSEKSDVWAAGVTCWEILTQGAEPYQEVHFLQVQRLVRDGLRLVLPAACPKPVAAAVTSCWSKKPERRPTFRSLADTFQQLRDTGLSDSPLVRDVGQTIHLLTASDA